MLRIGPATGPGLPSRWQGGRCGDDGIPVYVDWQRDAFKSRHGPLWRRSFSGLLAPNDRARQGGIYAKGQPTNISHSASGGIEFAYWIVQITFASLAHSTNTNLLDQTASRPPCRGEERQRTRQDRIRDEDEARRKIQGKQAANEKQTDKANKNKTKTKQKTKQKTNRTEKERKCGPAMTVPGLASTLDPR